MSARQYAEEFKKAIEALPWWSKIAGSQFIQGISNFVGQMVYRSEQYASRRFQEAFLSTAIKRASILAAAEDRGYVRRKVMPSHGTVTITNLSNEIVAIPKHTQLVSDAPLDYVLVEALELQPGQAKDVNIQQLKLRRFATKMIPGKKFFEFPLSKEISQITHKIDVFVEAGSASNQWAQSYMFRRANAQSRVYTEFYSPSEQLGIRFGNGANGMIPPDDSTIIINAWTTSGITVLIPGQTLSVENNEFISERVKVVTKTAILGGNEAEGTEDIRKGALYVTPFDGQLVWNDDYVFFIKTKIPEITWMRAWGEREEEIEKKFRDADNINCIFISCFSPGITQATMKTRVLKELEQTQYLNKTYKYRDAKEIGFPITLKGFVSADKDINDIKQKVQIKLNDLYGRDAVNRPKSWYIKDIWDTIADMNYFIRFTVEVGKVKVNPNDPNEVPKQPEEISGLNEYVYMDLTNKDTIIDIKFETHLNGGI